MICFFFDNTFGPSLVLDIQLVGFATITGLGTARPHGTDFGVGKVWLGLVDDMTGLQRTLGREIEVVNPAQKRPSW